ncbi:MAG: hypothetical protein WC023_15160 [Rhodocyclaceae bacterium]
MYIIAIGWLWVVLLMAITESNIVAGVLTFTFYGLLPCSLLMWLLATPMRRRRLAAKNASQPSAAGPDTETVSRADKQRADNTGQ